MIGREHPLRLAALGITLAFATSTPPRGLGKDPLLGLSPLIGGRFGIGMLQIRESSPLFLGFQDGLGDCGSHELRLFSLCCERYRIRWHSNGLPAPDAYSQLAQLPLGDFRWRVAHQVDGLGGFGKRDHFADRRLARENHHQPVQP